MRTYMIHSWNFIENFLQLQLEIQRIWLWLLPTRIGYGERQATSNNDNTYIKLYIFNQLVENSRPKTLINCSTTSTHVHLGFRHVNDTMVPDLYGRENCMARTSSLQSKTNEFGIKLFEQKRTWNDMSLNRKKVID